MAIELTESLANHLAQISLGHVTREYPNKLDHVLGAPGDVQGPKALHPIVYGSFDWHSCVHSHWMLARLLRRYPDMATAPRLGALLDGQFTPEKVAGERAYLARPEARGFERPYGWAWLLMLQAELVRHDIAAWAAALAPLARDFADRFRDWLPKALYPIRSGTHSSTAFALTLAEEYAASHDPALGGMLRTAARAWYGTDVDCQAWEPSGEDFLSPALMEAACMRRMLPS